MTIHALPGVKLPPKPPAELPYIEPAPTAEIFASALARVHVHGPYTRLIWTTEERVPEFLNDEANKAQNIAVCKIVVPTASLRAIYEAIGKQLVDRPAVD